MSTDTTAQCEGYCVKCKTKRLFGGTVTTNTKGMNLAKGPCPTCGTTVCRILGKAKTETAA